MGYIYRINAITGKFDLVQAPSTSSGTIVMGHATVAVGVNTITIGVTMAITTYDVSCYVDNGTGTQAFAGVVAGSKTDTTFQVNSPLAGTLTFTIG